MLGPGLGLVSGMGMVGDIAGVGVGLLGALSAKADKPAVAKVTAVTMMSKKLVEFLVCLVVFMTLYSAQVTQFWTAFNDQFFQRSAHMLIGGWLERPRHFEKITKRAPGSII
jgi:hypothetical protein